MAPSRRRAEHHDLAGRVARLCLRTFPRRFRERHGLELLRLHRDLLHRRHGERIPLRGVLAMAADLVTEGLAARREALAAATGTRNRGAVMEALLQDVRFAVRTLTKRPGFLLVGALSLALGIGANAVVFSMVNAFILRPMPYEEPDELLHVWSASRRGTSRVSVPNFLDWRAQARSFEDLAAFNYTIETLTGGEVPEQVSGGRLSANALPLLGVEPMLGRGFVEGEDRMGAEPVALIAERFWRERYGADPDIVGTSLEVNSVAHTIVGVVAGGMNFPLPITDVWMTRAMDDPAYGRDVHMLQVFGRLAPGVTAQQAAAEMQEIAARLEREYPEANEGLDGVQLEPLKAALNFADDVLRPVSALMTAAVGFVLLIACANVASLMLSRATTRGRELAVRSALGAGRRRLVRQMLTESLILALAGAVLGLVLAAQGTRSLDAALPADLYRVGSIAVDGAVLAYTVGLSLLTALAFGTLPALQATRGDLVDGLKQGTPGTGTSRRGARMQAALVAAEMTLSIVLLVGTALMLRSLVNLQRIDPGFRSDGVLTVRMLLPSSRYDDAATIVDFHRRLTERAVALPGVEAAATVDYLPLNHETNWPELAVVGRPAPPEPLSAVAFSVSPDYFRVMGIPLLSGRVFESLESQDGLPGVVVDATAVERFWGGEDPLGAEIELGDDGRLRVVGVVGATRQVGLAGAVEPVIYLSQADVPRRYMRLLVRTDGDPGALAASVRRLVAEVDPLLPLSEMRTLSTVVREFLLPQRMAVIGLAMLAVGALLLAAVGVYGLMAFFVAQRTREFGIHMALGATSAGVRRMIVSRVLRLSAWGVGLGLVAALALSRLMGSLLYGVGPADPVAFAGTVAFLVAVALAAGLSGARRATRVDPVRALRAE